MRPDGTSSTTMAEDVASSLVYADGKVYYLNGEGQLTSNQNGASQVISAAPKANALAAIGSDLYLACDDGIYRLSGDEVTQVIAGTYRNLVASSGTLYALDTAANTLVRIDGTQANVLTANVARFAMAGSNLAVVTTDNRLVLCDAAGAEQSLIFEGEVHELTASSSYIVASVTGSDGRRMVMRFTLSGTGSDGGTMLAEGSYTNLSLLGDWVYCSSGGKLHRLALSGGVDEIIDPA